MLTTGSVMNADHCRREPAVSRRRSLTAAGGLALAASGLFLPDGITDTRSREGVPGGIILADSGSGSVWLATGQRDEQEA